MNEFDGSRNRVQNYSGIPDLSVVDPTAVSQLKRSPWFSRIVIDVPEAFGPTDALVKEVAGKLRGRTESVSCFEDRALNAIFDLESANDESRRNVEELTTALISVTGAATEVSKCWTIQCIDDPHGLLQGGYAPVPYGESKYN